MIKTYANTAGSPATSGSGSKCRVMPTPEGVFYVKFVRPDTEAWHGPLNELLANQILGTLGCDRPHLAWVLLPDAIRNADADLAAVERSWGLGVASLPLAIDLYGPQILAAAEYAPDHELLSQHVVLTWLQNMDHRGKNFVGVGTRVVAIDFAGAPADPVWAGARLGDERPDHGGIAARLSRIGDSVRANVLDRLQSIGHGEVLEMLQDGHPDWSTPAERDHVAAEAMRTKEDVIAKYR